MTIWDTRTCRPLFVQALAHKGLTALQWLEGEQVLLSGAKDKHLKVWQFVKPITAEFSERAQQLGTHLLGRVLGQFTEGKVQSEVPLEGGEGAPSGVAGNPYPNVNELSGWDR